MLIELLENEYWYGSCVKYGQDMPLYKDSDCVLDFTLNRTPNQAMPVMVSTKGRYLWRHEGYQLRCSKGTIEVPDDVVLGSGYKTLRGAYLEAMKAYFPFEHTSLAKDLFRKPIYNTWIELTFNQNQEDVLAYARDIIASGMPAGTLMIDDGWSENYGDWSFHTGRFPNPGAMIQELKQLGFDVMLWICPYITPDTLAYRDALKKNLLIKDSDGSVFITDWWNGFSACLDLTNEETKAWITKQLQALMDLGIKGFKFDGGDSIHYCEDNLTAQAVSPDGMSNLWCQFGQDYGYNEFRASFGAGGYSLLQRLCDKDHSWGASGIHSLIPDTLLQGITGHPFVCPDMIGGGEYVNFYEAMDTAFDEELFVRHCEIAALMPAIQFSAAPFRVLSKDSFEAIMRSLRFRETFLPHIMNLVHEAEATGEPILRYMSYVFPDEPVETIIDQMMLGNEYLIAPVIEKGVSGRQVFLPSGKWKWHDQIIDGQGKWQFFASRYGEPLVFTRLRTRG